MGLLTLTNAYKQTFKDQASWRWDALLQ